MTNYVKHMAITIIACILFLMAANYLGEGDINYTTCIIISQIYCAAATVISFIKKEKLL